MSRAVSQLRELFRRPGVVRVVGAHDALGAKLAERAGFDGVWSSSFEISASHAVPDADILTMSEFLAAAQSMAGAVHIPIVADVDTGYGNSNNVIRMVQRFEAAGVAAVCIEDKQFPKVNSFIPGRQELAPVAEFVGKLMAAKSAQENPDFMVIARVEALIAGLGQAEALRRAHAYVEAGADAILIHDKSSSPDPIVQFVRAWDSTAPLVVVPTTYYRITVEELDRLGVKAVIYANQGLRSSIRAMEETFAEILKAGSSAPVEDRIAPTSLVFELQGFPQLKRHEENFLRSGRKWVRAIIPAAGDHMDEYSMKDISGDIPIAMLDIKGKPLLQRQVEMLNAAGISDITVVGGYKRDKIVLDGVKLASNDDWRTTGDMRSILCGAGGPDGDTLIAYSDILFDCGTAARLAETEADIALLVDITFPLKSYGQGRLPTLVALSNPRPPLSRALNAGAPSRVLKIGQRLPSAEAHGEYTGLAMFSKKGFGLLRQVYQEASEAHGDGPFQESASVLKASLTDLVQELIDRGHAVGCVEVSSGWMEVHSLDDYRLAHRLVT
jgi:phosphoenolpyruvate phosphomutase